MGILKCEVETDTEGMMTWRAAGKVVALRMPSGRVVDCRVDPPFVAFVPCPWCVGVHGLDSKGKEHDALSHVDPSIGFHSEPSTCGPKGNHSDHKNHCDGEVTRCKVCGETIWATIGVPRPPLVISAARRLDQ